MKIRIYSLISTLIVSLISIIWIVFLGLHQKIFKKIVIYLVSFSAWALLGDVFIHILPEINHEWIFTLKSSLFILGGIFFWLITEKIIHRNHCHMPITKTHVHHFAIMNLVGDFVHNIIDGIIIWASYLVNIPLGIATTTAVALHEIPQEIWDFWVLVHWGLSKKKALLLNFLTGLSAILWVIIALLISNHVKNITSFLMPFAAWSFIYIASADLIPELHKENKTKQALFQIVFFLLGVGVMTLLLLGE